MIFQQIPFEDSLFKSEPEALINNTKVTDPHHN
jgi:hypothetical protein